MLHRVQCCPVQGLQGNLEGLDHLWECQWGMVGVRVCVISIDSPFGWRGGSGGSIVLFELLDGHITQKFVDVGRKKDGSTRPSGGGSASGRGSGRLPRGNGGDIGRPSEVGSVDLVEFLCWHVNATIGGTCGGGVLGRWVVRLVRRNFMLVGSSRGW